MDLSRIIPERFFRYQWQRPQAEPYDPATGVPFPLSRHAWGSIGSSVGQVPNGAAVAAGFLQPDGTRGALNVWADWFQGIGGNTNLIKIGLLKTGDAVPPAFALNPTNAKNGRSYAIIDPADTSHIVATKIVGSALSPMLSVAGLQAKFSKAGGQIIDNFARADLGTGTVVILSPAPWRPTQPAILAGVWSAMAYPEDFESHQGQYRPEFLAGCRPAPWLVVGNSWAGRGEDHTLIG